MRAPREDLEFGSGHDRCAAWLYRPANAGEGNVPCVVMAHGFSMTRHDGLEPYAEALVAQGIAVLLFDHRFLGDSGGEPRQHFAKKLQIEDWRNAIAFARTLDGIDGARLGLWGFSFSAAHVTQLLCDGVDVRAAMVVCPFLDGLARVLANPLPSTARILPKAMANLAGRPVRIPITSQPGGPGALSFAGEADGFAGSVPEGSPWRNEIAPGLFATVAFHRPARRATRITQPLWVGLGERDITVNNKAVERLAQRAPHGELHRYDSDHFDLFADPALAAEIAADQAAFARAHLVS